MNPYKILLADGYASFRRAVKKIIEEVPGLMVIGEVSDAFGLVRFLDRSSPDMIILDIFMPYAQAVDFAKKIKAHYPEIKILILSEHIANEYLARALEAGVEGFLLKENALPSLVKAIETIRLGKSYISSQLGGKVLRERYYAGVGGRKTLTSREMEVLKLTAQGISFKEIAKLLAISPRTAQNYRLNIKNKLNLRKNAELVRYALEKGYI